MPVLEDTDRGVAGSEAVLDCADQGGLSQELGRQQLSPQLAFHPVEASARGLYEQRCVL